MEIRDALHHELVGQMEASVFAGHLQRLILLKENEVHLLREKIIKYEQKSRAEDVFYQSLSPIRKLFTSRPPTHHRAVEYMVNVRDRMKKIETLKKQTVELREILTLLTKNPQETLFLSLSTLDELRSFFSTKEMFDS